MNADNLYPSQALLDLAGLDEPGLPVFDRDDLITSSSIPPERIRAFAIVDVTGDGYLRRIVEKPAALVDGAARAGVDQHELLAFRRTHLRSLS